jgi:hypothetical protein
MAAKPIEPAPTMAIVFPGLPLPGRHHFGRRPLDRWPPTVSCDDYWMFSISWWISFSVIGLRLYTSKA